MDYVQDAEGQVREKEGGEDEGHPDVEDGGRAKDFRVAEERADGLGPDGGAVVAGEDHDGAGDYEALCEMMVLVMRRGWGVGYGGERGYRLGR